MGFYHHVPLEAPKCSNSLEKILVITSLLYSLYHLVHGFKSWPLRVDACCVVPLTGDGGGGVTAITIRR